MALAHSVAFVFKTPQSCGGLNCTVGIKWLNAKSLRWMREELSGEQPSSNSQTMCNLFSLSALLRPFIPQAATLCSPRLWSFSTKFKLKKFLRPTLSGDEPPPLSFAVGCAGFVLWLWCRLWWGKGDAEMPCSCSSCRSPSDELVTFVVVVVVVRSPRPKCGWDGDEVLTSSQFRQDGRPKEWRLPTERNNNWKQE